MAHRRDFFKDFDCFALEIAFFCSLVGESLGSEGFRGVPRGKLRREALDFLLKGVKFPGKFPETCFSRRGQISNGISRNLRQGQLVMTSILLGIFVLTAAWLQPDVVAAVSR